MKPASRVRAPGPQRFSMPWGGALLALTLFTPAASAYTVPSEQIEAALADAAPADAVPIEFAVALPVSAAAAALDWQPDADGREWTLSLHSPGAVSLSVQLSFAALPDSAQVQFESADGALRHGPYHPSANNGGALWTPIVAGDRARLRVRLPFTREAPPAVTVEQLFHGYRDAFRQHIAKDLGDSGSCNVDTACPAASEWQDDARSTARLQIDGTRLCTGVLVNNLRQDLRPYVLTADHCQIGPGADDSPASSVVFYWNLANQSCGGDSSTADTSQTTSGARFVADDVGADFTLLVLEQDPPLTYNLYFAGIDAGNEAPANGVSIHHPSGDTRKISFYTGPATRSQVNIGDGRIVEAWRVNWDQGTTEPGSSGGGLWNAAHRVVGLLSGGTASCSNQDEPDFYGRLEEAWEAGSSNTSQLKAHLDPDNTCQRSVSGRNATDGAGSPVSGTACASSNNGEGSVGGALNPLLLSVWLIATAFGWRRQR